MARQLKLHLEGDNAHLGVVAASDVAKLILAMEKAVADAAAQIIGRTPGLTGRKGAAVEAATHFRLVAVRKGSVMPILELPSPADEEGALSIGDSSLGVLAVDATMATMAGDDDDPLIANSLARLGEEIGIGSRYDVLTIDDYQGTHMQRRVTLDKRQCTRLRTIASGRVPGHTDAVVGTLFEADFEKFTARVRTPAHGVVSVVFDPIMADEIQEVLRHQTELVGRVQYQRTTGRIQKVEARRIVRTEQLVVPVDGLGFSEERTVADFLAARESPVAMSALEVHDPDASDDEIDAFFGALLDQ